MRRPVPALCETELLQEPTLESGRGGYLPFWLGASSCTTDHACLLREAAVSRSSKMPPSVAMGGCHERFWRPDRSLPWHPPPADWTEAPGGSSPMLGVALLGAELSSKYGLRCPPGQPQRGLEEKTKTPDGNRFPMWGYESPGAELSSKNEL
mmetsp:Transcript_39028/g.72671  ORF Transcript_39028/g.72671 Transcript_39028/m.72671 type:complete len:152 (-) Transcript_39028:28-483(-)